MDMRKVVRIDHETDGKAYRHAAEHRGQARKLTSNALHDTKLFFLKGRLHQELWQ